MKGYKRVMDLWRCVNIRCYFLCQSLLLGTTILNDIILYILTVGGAGSNSGSGHSIAASVRLSLINLSRHLSGSCTSVLVCTGSSRLDTKFTTITHKHTQLYTRMTLTDIDERHHTNTHKYTQLHINTQLHTNTEIDGQDLLILMECQGNHEDHKQMMSIPEHFKKASSLQ